MAKRAKSLDEIRSQISRIRREARAQRNFRFLGRANETAARYADNIRNTRRFQQDFNLWNEQVNEFRAARERGESQAALSAGQRGNDAYRQAMYRPYPRNVYMGLNNG